jgi:predicted methyltransferase
MVKKPIMDNVRHVICPDRPGRDQLRQETPIPMKSGRFAAILALSLSALVLSACGEKPADKPAAEGADKSGQGSLEWAVAGKWRMDAEKARDPDRHPVETLKFFGVKGSDTVVEIFPGGGWFTAILGPYLKAGGGKLYAAHPDPASSPGAKANVDAYAAAFVLHPETYGAIEVTVASKDGPGLAPDGTADAVLTFRNVHNWMMGGYAEKIFADAFKALKPGGVLGVEEHRLPSARDQDLGAATGYVSVAYVTQLAQNAGFVLEEESEINANPKDKADHPVWMLPPNLRPPAPDSPEAAGYDVETYKAIGESDRMTLRFRKPNTAQPGGPTTDAPPAPAAPAAAPQSSAPKPQ